MKVIKKEYIGNLPVYDLSVEHKDHSFSLSSGFKAHNCAFLIADAPIEDIVPITEVGGVNRVTAPEAKQCEWAGLIKYDFLIVKGVKTNRICLDYINEKNKSDIETGYFMHEGKKTFVWDLPNDPETYKMLHEGKTETVFQFNTATATPLVIDIKPENIIDLATITSLGRPGPLDFKDERTGRNMATEFGFRKRGQSKAHLDILQEILPETHGIIVFQEQINTLAKDLAGMNVNDSENLRIAVGKKKKKLIDSLKPVFIAGATKRIGESQATEIWDMMETFAKYGFNLSHSVAYSVISYSNAFFKQNYNLEWWAAVLTTSDSKKINEEYYKYIKDMILPPDINVSTERISIDYNLGKLRSKLSMINGLGKKSAAKIMKGRPYTNVEDFIDKKVAGPALTRKLIHLGVLDSLFDKEDCTLLRKMQKYEDAAQTVFWKKKLNEYKEKIETEEDDSKIKRLNNNMQKYKDKGPKKGEVDAVYIMITPKNDFLMKKKVFPTINLDLNKVLLNDSTQKILPSAGYNRILDQYGRETVLVSGEHLHRIDEINTETEIKCCCPAYVVDASEFTYQNGAKKALKLNLDSSGYISEKVLWSDYDTNELIYPKELKKGAIIFVYYKRKMNSKGKCYTNITQIVIENEAI